MAKAFEQGIKVLEAALALVEESLWGASGDEYARLVAERRGIEARIVELRDRV